MNISVNLTPELRLGQALKEEDPSTVTHLTVFGTLTYDDFEYILEKMGETLQALDIGNTSVEKLDYPYFDEFTELKSITLPASLTELGIYIFAYCSALTSIIIPNSVTEVGYGAFEGCTALTSVTIPDSVTKIGHHAFSGCTSLTSVNIPDSVTEIGLFAFYKCCSLPSVFIPASLVKIERQAFDCPASITVHPDNPVYKSVKGKIRRKGKSNIKRYPNISIAEEINEMSFDEFQKWLIKQIRKEEKKL